MIEGKMFATTKRGGNALNDEAIMDEFTRIRFDMGQTYLEVMEIGWCGHHEPSGYWATVKTFFEPLSEHKERQERLKALQRKKFFKVCNECGERNPVGWMHNKEICQQCAHENHGVIY